MSDLIRGSRVALTRDPDALGTVLDLMHEGCPPAQRVALVQWDDDARGVDAEWWGAQSLQVSA